MKKLISFLAVGSMALSLVLVNEASADSTIGTSITTTGSLTVNSASGTAVRFQNGSGTNLFVFDTSKTRFGTNSGGALDTKLEVGGTASATYFLSSDAVQFASNVASVAYSRFGSTTTNHANYISASNDLLVSGDVEIRGSASFGGTASVSGIFFMNDGQHRPNVNSATAFRFQNAAGSTNVLTIDTTNTRVGVNAGGAVDTTFEVGGTSSISGLALFGGNASVAGNFELTASSPLFGVNAGALIDTTLEVGGTASVSGIITLGGSGTTGGQIRPAVNGTTAFRFQNAAGTTNVLTIDTTNLRIGVGKTPSTKFEVGGTASATYFISANAVQFASNVASVAYSRFGSTATTHANYISAANDLLVSGDVEVRGSVSFATIASIGTNFSAGENSTATTSATFKTRSATQGACFIVTDTTGTVKYARIRASDNTWVINTTACN